MKTQTLVLIAFLVPVGCGTNGQPLNNPDSSVSAPGHTELSTPQQDNTMTSDTDDRRAKLFSQMATYPVSEVIGVVNATGPGAAMTPSDLLWSFGFGLAAWRVGDGPVQRDELRVRREVTKEELDRLMTQIKPDTVVRIQARIAKENAAGSPQALLERFLRVDNSDPALQECLAALQEPVTFADDFFGVFTHQRSVDVYATPTTWMEAPVQLRLWFIAGDVKSALEAARVLWADQIGWDKRVRDCAAAELLPLKSENWQEEDGSSVSRKQFEKRMSLRSITVEPNGDFEFWYDDGGLFLGHDIVVYGNVRTGIKSATIQG